jgi:hypothetical protein
MSPASGPRKQYVSPESVYPPANPHGYKTQNNINTFATRTLDISYLMLTAIVGNCRQRTSNTRSLKNITKVLHSTIVSNVSWHG